MGSSLGTLIRSPSSWTQTRRFGNAKMNQTAGLTFGHS